MAPKRVECMHNAFEVIERKIFQDGVLGPKSIEKYLKECLPAAKKEFYLTYICNA